MHPGDTSELLHDPALPRSDGLHHVRLGDGRGAVLKRRSDAPPGFFAAEARGLETLARHSGLHVAGVLACSGDALLIEDLGHGAPRSDFDRLAGEGLAIQHGVHGKRFGFGHSGWCGDTPQSNREDEDGWRFFARQRLLPQMHRAVDAGRLQTPDAVRVESIAARLPDLIPDQPPVLLHGDLWSGNLHCCGDGTPALIDAAAVHYGWAEAELAMLTLFGAPGTALFEAYATTAPLSPDWHERAPLYNLYHLLNHLNLFGGSYLGAVRRVLDRYT